VFAPAVNDDCQTPKGESTNRKEIKRIEHHLRTAKIVRMEPLEGSTIGKKMGQCDVCWERLNKENFRCFNEEHWPKMENA
jgi:hypothetical protein